MLRYRAGPVIASWACLHRKLAIVFTQFLDICFPFFNLKLIIKGVFGFILYSIKILLIEHGVLVPSFYFTKKRVVWFMEV